MENYLGGLPGLEVESLFYKPTVKKLAKNISISSTLIIRKGPFM